MNTIRSMERHMLGVLVHLVLMGVLMGLVLRGMYLSVMAIYVLYMKGARLV